MSDKCYFDVAENRCEALKVKECEGCKFRKTEAEFYDGIAHSKEILKSKGLIAVSNYIDDVMCVTTEKEY